MNEELKSILEKFADCGWELIDGISKEYLEGTAVREELVEVIKLAEEQCGSCGCEFDPLYKRALELL